MFCKFSLPKKTFKVKITPGSRGQKLVSLLKQYTLQEGRKAQTEKGDSKAEVFTLEHSNVPDNCNYPQACNCPLKKKRTIFTTQVRSEAAETPQDMIPTMVPQKMLRFIMLLGAFLASCTRLILHDCSCTLLMPHKKIFKKTRNSAENRQELLLYSGSLSTSLSRSKFLIGLNVSTSLLQSSSGDFYLMSR